jgi:hypothetical protein
LWLAQQPRQQRASNDEDNKTYKCAEDKVPSTIPKYQSNNGSNNRSNDPAPRCAGLILSKIFHVVSLSHSEVIFCIFIVFN